MRRINSTGIYRFSNRIIFTIILVLVASLVLAACGSAQAQSTPLSLGDPVPAFTLATFDGKEIDTAELSGKVIVVNFWASWCKPCEQEAADLQEAWERYEQAGEVVFLGVAYLDTEPESRKYLERFSVTYPNGPDTNSNLSRMFLIRAIPQTFVIGKDGRLKQLKIGAFESLSEVTTVIDEWVNE